MARRWVSLLAALACAGLLASEAIAQIQLHGATDAARPRTTPHATGAPDRSNGGSAPRVPPKPVVIAAPGEETILGHLLIHDGSKGTMQFDKAGMDIVLTTLTLTGDKISKPGDPCSVAVSMAVPVVTTNAGRPAGAIRLEVPVAACPFAVDILQGAVLVSRPVPTCDFVAANCRVAPGGLWGPAAAAISAKQIKELEHERIRIETTMRANFRALLKRAGKDRSAVKEIASEQAAFSSEREMICRDYQNESVHGFCSTQITEARALALLAKFASEPEQQPGSRSGAGHRRTRPKRKAATQKAVGEPAGDAASR